MIFIGSLFGHMVTFPFYFNITSCIEAIFLLIHETKSVRLASLLILGQTKVTTEISQVILAHS